MRSPSPVSWAGRSRIRPRSTRPVRCSARRPPRRPWWVTPSRWTSPAPAPPGWPGRSGWAPLRSTPCPAFWRRRRRHGQETAPDTLPAVQHLPLPVEGDYDFERSTFRYRLFGDDVASRWYDGGLHRVLRSGLAVRITAAGVTAWGEPTEADRAELAHVLGAHFDLERFAASWPALAARSPGFRPPLLADPFE